MYFIVLSTSFLESGMFLQISQANSSVISSIFVLRPFANSSTLKTKNFLSENVVEHKKFQTFESSLLHSSSAIDHVRYSMLLRLHQELPKTFFSEIMHNFTLSEISSQFFCYLLFRVAWIRPNDNWFVVITIIYGRMNLFLKSIIVVNTLPFMFLCYRYNRALPFSDLSVNQVGCTVVMWRFSWPLLQIKIFKYLLFWIGHAAANQLRKNLSFLLLQKKSPSSEGFRFRKFPKKMWFCWWYQNQMVKNWGKENPNSKCEMCEEKKM